jgi:hypothetical protein
MLLRNLLINPDQVVAKKMRERMQVARSVILKAYRLTPYVQKAMYRRQQVGLF